MLEKVIEESILGVSRGPAPTVSCLHSCQVPDRHFGNVLLQLRLSSYNCQCRLINAFSSEKNSSIGFKSGEYGGKYTIFTPACEHISSILSEWWKDALSITITDFSYGHLPQCWSSSSIKSLNTKASVEPRKMRDIRSPSWEYAGWIWYRWSRWNLATCIGANPRRDQPVFLKPILLSQPDSSTNKRWCEENSNI